MPNLDVKVAEVAEQLLKRPLTNDEQLEIYRISDVMGMTNIHSFLHQLLVFKLHEDTLRRQFEDLHKFEDRLNERFDAMSASESRIHDTLERSVDRILGEGARAIASDMGEEIAASAKSLFTGAGSYYRLKGQIIVACLFWPVAAISYLLGHQGALRWIPNGSIFEGFAYLPAGWCFFLCGVIFTFLWVGDHWYDIRKKLLFKVLLGLQVFTELLLALSML